MTVDARPRLDTTPVDAATAAALEAAEARAWVDLYAAAPPDWAAGAGVRTREVAGATVLSWAATGRRYFSRPIGFGVFEPATEAALDDILDGYEAEGISMFLLMSLPHCRPAAYEDWLRDRGLEPFDAHDRLIRGGEPLPSRPVLGRELGVERVGPETADEWADFLQRVYTLDTGPWLQRLIGRPGWHQYVARRNGRVVGARALYVDCEGTGWMGMDGPVPGVHTTEYEQDAALCTAIVADALGLGVRLFHADIEAPSERMDTPAYDYFAELGFRRPYVRTHWRTA